MTDGRWRGRRLLRQIGKVPDYDPKRKVEVSAYRIEWYDGMPTERGLFNTIEAASRYAGQRGWPLRQDAFVDEACA